MHAWRVTAPGPDVHRALRRDTIPVPRPAPGELLLAVDAYGVCRTDLHVTVGDLPLHQPGVVSGHEIVAHVLEARDGVTGFAAADRVGVAWLRRTP